MGWEMRESDCDIGRERERHRDMGRETFSLPMS